MLRLQDCSFPGHHKQEYQQLKLEIEVVKEPKQAVTDLDIVVTSGPVLKTPTPVIEVDWLSEGSFASPVDFDSYWQGEALDKNRSYRQNCKHIAN